MTILRVSGANSSLISSKNQRRSSACSCAQSPKKNHPHPAQKSRFQFKNWVFSDTGERVRAEYVRVLEREHAHLVSTCYFNSATKTKTLYCIVWDLDASRAQNIWKDESGALSWSRIAQVLATKHPEIFRYIFAVVRSTGGKGLGVAIAISPLELISRTEGCQRAARALQAKILHLFNYYGFGADPGALGLDRDMPNWHDTSRFLGGDKRILTLIQSEYDRRPVVIEVLNYLKTIPFLRYQKKREDESLLYYDERAEKKLAKLYKYLYEDLSYYHFLSTKEIQSITGLSLPFLRKFLKKGAPWLQTEWKGKHQGWSLSIYIEGKAEIDEKYLLRCESILRDNLPRKSRLTGLLEPLKKPSDVQDGERNEWITKVTLNLKHSGIEENKAQDLISKLIPKIPDHQLSRNCRHANKIVKNIYKKQPQYFGIRPADDLPAWLVSVSTKASREKRITFMKGLYPSAPFLGLAISRKSVKVSRDCHFVFDRNYYSVPGDFVGLCVDVLATEQLVRVYDGETLVAQHLRVSGKGRHVTVSKHLPEVITEQDSNYIDRLVSSVSFLSVSKGSRAEYFVRSVAHPFLSLRKLWALYGSVSGG